MKTKQRQSKNMQPTKKTFQSITGQWIEKRTKTEILLCLCGNKYIKTRKDQKVCIRCIYRTLPERAS
ncbi:MAG: hypothetical protein COV91_04960 [Candidatus Taylorbacteria bacterium CG11_big_fil_rev_8_21_14_0_20_46_11]|uniref:Uncharacterized protein n=1 Tax=Candidatus Taylorbacteria bacterium CG11_big_fil_rev_8_21_14_0_20_46_11 TaxID=1975025 RepID=A0A2H0KAK2_9BACT|nr:MAG: hypothetical protein COV91_04960 [Candidatus Taylorbacteria bacterium CG11_big_fil_rev_8_21_14_0_20_46_11]